MTKSLGITIVVFVGVTWGFGCTGEHPSTQPNTMPATQSSTQPAAWLTSMRVQEVCVSVSRTILPLELGKKYIAVACEASEAGTYDPDNHRRDIPEVTQRFTVKDVLWGKTSAKNITISYNKWEVGPGLPHTGGAVLRGQTIIWIVDASTIASNVWHAVRGMSDSQAKQASLRKGLMPKDNDALENNLSCIPVANSLDFDYEDFVDVLRYLSDLTGAPVIARWDALEKVEIRKRTPITLHLRIKDLSVKEIMVAILQSVPFQAKLDYLLNESHIIISTRDDIASIRKELGYSSATAPASVDTKHLFTRSYDVSDMVFRDLAIDTESPPVWSNDDLKAVIQASQARFLAANAQRIEESYASLIESVQSACNKSSWRWREFVHSGVQEADGQLAVRQTAENHRKIVELFRTLRDMTWETGNATFIVISDKDDAKLRQWLKIHASGKFDEKAGTLLMSSDEATEFLRQAKDVAGVTVTEFLNLPQYQECSSFVDRVTDKDLTLANLSEQGKTVAMQFRQGLALDYKMTRDRKVFTTTLAPSVRRLISAGAEPVIATAGEKLTVTIHDMDYLLLRQPVKLAKVIGAKQDIDKESGLKTWIVQTTPIDAPVKEYLYVLFQPSIRFRHVDLGPWPPSSQPASNPTSAPIAQPASRPAIVTATKPARILTTQASLAIEMAASQPADAPVILQARLTNTSDKPISGYFDHNKYFRAYLTGPDGMTRAVAVTNGSHIDGFFTKRPSDLAVGQSVTCWLRLTTYQAVDRRDYLPSEYVFLPPGEYRLRLVRLFDDKDGQTPIVQATANFTVIKDAALAKARWNEIRKPAKTMQQFAEHVKNATLTPELRQQWYKDILKDDIAEAARKVYLLSIIENPPPDVAPAIAAVLKLYVDNPKPASRQQANLLNDAAYFLLNHHPAGADEALLKMATNCLESSYNSEDVGTVMDARMAAIDALRYYWRDDMADKIATVLNDQHRGVPIYAARLLAWAGDARGVDELIDETISMNYFAAASLAYLPSNQAAAEALKNALISPDRRFRQRLNQAIIEQPPARNSSTTQPASAPGERYFTTVRPGDGLCNAKQEVVIAADVAEKMFVAEDKHLAAGWEKLLPSGIKNEANAIPLPDVTKWHGQPPASKQPFAHVAAFSDTKLVIRISEPGGRYLWHGFEDNLATLVVPRTANLDAAFNLPKLKKEFASDYRGIIQGDSLRRVEQALGKPTRIETTQSFDYSHLFYANDAVQIDIWRGKVWKVIYLKPIPTATQQAELNSLVEELADRIVVKRACQPYQHMEIRPWFKSNFADATPEVQAKIVRLFADEVAKLQDGKDWQTLGTLHDRHHLIQYLEDMGAHDELLAILERQNGFDCCAAPAMISGIVACGNKQDAWLIVRKFQTMGHDGGVECLNEALTKLTGLTITEPAIRTQDAYAKLWAEKLTQAGIKPIEATTQPATTATTQPSNQTRPVVGL